MHCIHSVVYIRRPSGELDDLAASPVVRICEFDSRQDNLF